MNDWRDMHNGDYATPDWRKDDSKLETMPCSQTEYDELKAQKDELILRQSDLDFSEYRKKLLVQLDRKITYAKTTGMPQFVMGLLQAKKVIELFKNGEHFRED